MTLREALLACLEQERLTTIPVDEHTLIGCARANDDRPSYIKLYVPDAFVANLVGNHKLTDSYFLVRIPREVIEQKQVDLVAAAEVAQKV